MLFLLIFLVVFFDFELDELASLQRPLVFYLVDDFAGFDLRLLGVHRRPTLILIIGLNQKVHCHFR